MRLISYGTFTRPRVYQDLLVTCCTFKSWYLNVLILNIFLTNAEEDNIRSHSKTLGTCIGYEPLIWYGRRSWHSSIGNIALTIWNSHRGTLFLGHHRSSRGLYRNFSRTGRKNEVKNEMNQGSGDMTTSWMLGWCDVREGLPRHHVLLDLLSKKKPWGNHGESWEWCSPDVD